MAAPTNTATLLSTFQKHIEDMRNLVMCKICIKPLYEPYIISCGHTFCYSCLTSWFGGSGATRKQEKKCPDCRALVRVQPAPNYVLRDLSHMFISRTELLPEDETTEEHEASKQLETAQMTSDRNGVGLFQGAFKPGVHRDPLFMRPIHDLEDGVDRCPDCAWELEDGMCLHCGFEGFGAGVFSDDDESMDESGDDDSSDSQDTQDPDLDHGDDPIDADFDGHPFAFARVHHVANAASPPPSPYMSLASTTSPDRGTTGSEESDDSDDSEVRPHPPIDYGASDYSRDSSPPVYRRYSDLDDDDDDEDDDDTDMEGFVVRDNEVLRDDDDISRRSSASSIPHTHSRTRRVVYDSDLSGDESVSDSDDTAILMTNGQRAPPSEDSSSSDGSDSDDETPVPETRLGGRRRPLVIPDDDDDEDSVEGEGFSAASMSETNPTRPRSLGQHPPQSRASRASRLNNQRAARRVAPNGSGRRGGSGHYHSYANSIRSPSVEIYEARPRRGEFGRGGRPYASRPALST